MKTHWLGFWIIIILSFMLAGCPPPGDATKPGVTGTLDATKQPPPQAALADTPDLYKGKFQVTDLALGGMKTDGLPDGVASKLASLKGQEFSNAKNFLSAVGGAIGTSALNQHRESIVRHSLIVELAVEPSFPGDLLSSDLFMPVFFEFDRYNIRPEFVEVIKTNALVLKEYADQKFVIEGHCDERGTTEYNLALGERRARAIKNALVGEGIASSRLKIVSYGEERAADPGHNEEAWAKNRRGLIVIP